MIIICTFSHNHSFAHSAPYTYAAVFFGVYDTDRDGYITQQQMARMLAAILKVGKKTSNPKLALRVTYQVIISYKQLFVSYPQVPHGVQEAWAFKPTPEGIQEAVYECLHVSVFALNEATL